MNDTFESYDGLPGSQQLSGFCLRCGRYTGFTIQTQSPIGFNYQSQENLRTCFFSGVPTEMMFVLACLNCGQGVVVIEEIDKDSTTHNPVDGSTRQKLVPIHWWPPFLISLSSDIPAVVSSAIKESAMALNYGLYRSSAAMSRRAVEAICDHLGATKGMLIHRINNLANEGKLQPTIAEWAHEVRELGNDGVHDLIKEVIEEDARDIYKFNLEFVKYVFEMPADLQRKRNKKQS